MAVYLKPDKQNCGREIQTPWRFAASNKSWRLQPPTEGQPGVMDMGNVAPGFAVCVVNGDRRAD